MTPTAHRLVIFPQSSRIPGRRHRWYVRLVSTRNGRTVLGAGPWQRTGRPTTDRQQ